MMRGSNKKNDIQKEMKKPFVTMQKEHGTSKHSAGEGAFLAQIELASSCKFLNRDVSDVHGLIARLNKPNDDATESVILSLKADLRNQPNYNRFRKTTDEFIRSPRFLRRVVYRVCELQLALRAQVRKYLDEEIEQLRNQSYYKDMTEDHQILNAAVKRCDVVTNYFTKENIGIATISAEVIHRVVSRKDAKPYEIEQYIDGCIDSIKQNYIAYWTGVKDDVNWNINKHYMDIHPAPEVGKQGKKKPCKLAAKNLKDGSPISHFAIHGCTEDGANFKNTGAIKANESKVNGILSKCHALIDIARSTDSFTNEYPNRMIMAPGTQDSPFIDVSPSGEVRCLNFNHRTEQITFIKNGTSAKNLQSGHLRAHSPKHPNVKTWKTMVEYSEDNNGKDKTKDRNPFIKCINELRALHEDEEINVLLKQHFKLQPSFMVSEDTLLESLRYLLAKNIFEKYPESYYDVISQQDLWSISEKLQLGSYVLEDDVIDANCTEAEYLAECAKQVRPPTVSQSANIIMPK